MKLQSFLFPAQQPRLPRPSAATWGDQPATMSPQRGTSSWSHVSAVSRRGAEVPEAAGPPTGARPAVPLPRPPATSPRLGTHAARPTWLTARRSTCVRRRRPARASRRSSASSPRPRAQRPLPTLRAEACPPPVHPPPPPDLPKLCTSPASSQRPRDLPLLAREFPQHGALERARECAQALLPAAPRARLPWKPGLDVRARAQGLLLLQASP